MSYPVSGHVLCFTKLIFCLIGDIVSTLSEIALLFWAFLLL